MVKNSINEIMGEDKWNPNLILKSEIVYKFNGSPAPKKGTFMFGSGQKTPAKKRASLLVTGEHP